MKAPASAWKSPTPPRRNDSAPPAPHLRQALSTVVSAAAAAAPSPARDDHHPPHAPLLLHAPLRRRAARRQFSRGPPRLPRRRWRTGTRPRPSSGCTAAWRCCGRAAGKDGARQRGCARRRTAEFQAARERRRRSTLPSHRFSPFPFLRYTRCVTACERTCPPTALRLSAPAEENTRQHRQATGSSVRRRATGRHGQPQCLSARMRLSTLQTAAEPAQRRMKRDVAAPTVEPAHQRRSCPPGQPSPGW